MKAKNEYSAKLIRTISTVQSEDEDLNTSAKWRRWRNTVQSDDQGLNTVQSEDEELNTVKSEDGKNTVQSEVKEWIRRNAVQNEDEE